MQNDLRAAIRAEAARLEQAFVAAGALPSESDALVSAETLLDLYGEDIRARAYVTHDPARGEQMLRPDFTVPIVERHMAEGAEPARYTYNGSVWRKQEPGSTRAAEFTQVGFELFDRADPAGADAEVFALFQGVLPDDLTITTGDVGILRAAVMGLNTTDVRKAALMRHLWRPARFAELLARFGGQAPAPVGRAELLAEAQARGAAGAVHAAGEFVGLRSEAEIVARIDALAADAQTAPISSDEVELLQDVQQLNGSLSAVAQSLADMAAKHASLSDAAAVFGTRVQALASKGLAVEALPFVGNYGLTSMEYYDGFVFGFTRGDTVVASGGRYDALTRVLGNGRAIAAVGGVIRPDALIGEP